MKHAKMKYPMESCKFVIIIIIVIVIIVFITVRVSTQFRRNAERQKKAIRDNIECCTGQYAAQVKQTLHYFLKRYVLRDVLNFSIVHVPACYVMLLWSYKTRHPSLSLRKCWPN